MTMLAVDRRAIAMTIQAVELTALRFAISKPYLMISQVDAGQTKLVKIDVVQRKVDFMTIISTRRDRLQRVTSKIWALNQ